MISIREQAKALILSNEYVIAGIDRTKSEAERAAIADSIRAGTYPFDEAEIDEVAKHLSYRPRPNLTRLPLDIVAWVAPGIAMLAVLWALAMFKRGDSRSAGLLLAVAVVFLALAAYDRFSRRKPELCEAEVSRFAIPAGGDPSSCLIAT